MKGLASNYLTIGRVRLDLGISFFTVRALRDFQRSQNPFRALQEKTIIKVLLRNLRRLWESKMLCLTSARV